MLVFLEDVRPFDVECDWCGRKLSGQMRRSQIGQTIVVQESHVDESGRRCLGSGRSLGTWPLRVELRQTNEGYEIRIGNGRARVHPSRESVVSVLRDLGVDRDDAQRQVAKVEPGQPIIVEVGERRKTPRGHPDR
jgi:hypothetical protein